MRNSATNFDAGREVKFAFVKFPGAPLEPLDGLARVAGNEARWPKLVVRKGFGSVAFSRVSLAEFRAIPVAQNGWGRKLRLRWMLVLLYAPVYPNSTTRLVLNSRWMEKRHRCWNCAFQLRSK